MRTNVFLRSTRRQPVRTALLLLVTALVTFTFVGRASEYLLISREIDRLGSYYRTIGTLRAVTRQADTNAAAACLEADRRVQVVNIYNNLSGVIQDGFYNADEDWEAGWYISAILSRYENALNSQGDPRREFSFGDVIDPDAMHRALSVVPLRDMSALPAVQEGVSQMYLTEGRWLDSQDDQAASRVCVISANLAALRDLHIGDTITLELRDTPSYFGYCLPLSQEDYDGIQNAETATETFEIVGMYDNLGKYKLRCIRNFLYIPASTVPETFSMSGELDPKLYAGILSDMTASGTQAPPALGEVSFALADPETAARFTAGTRADLLKLGFRLELVDNGWENFQAAVTPMRRASRFQLFVYLLVLLAALCLADFVYFRARSKELAIVRAMGLPAGRCVREGTLPLLLIALPGILAGGALGWRHTRQNAEQTLSALASLDEGGGAGTALPPVYLALLWGGVLALLLVLTVGCALFLAKRPVLEQMQGTSKPRGKSRRGPVETPPPNTADLSLEAVRGVRAVTPAERRRWRQVPAALRFIRRQIARAPVKTALAAGLAAAFTAGLGVIGLSIESDRQELDRLYEVTPVDLDLVRRDSTRTALSSGFLFEETVQAVLDTGFVSDCYLEGASHCRVFLYDGPWEAGEPLHVEVQEQTNRTIRSFEDVERFFSAGGSGEGVTVTYLDGWDSGLFSEDWTAGDDVSLPIVLPKETYDQYGLQPGDSMGVACKGTFHICTVAGYYEGEVAGDSTDRDSRSLYNEYAPILMPTSALKALSANVLYSRASFTVNPAQKRDLEAFRTAIDELAGTAHIGNTPIRALLRDEELTEAVAPLEESLQLMRLLYPVVFVLSLLTAAGAAALFVMMSAKDAATLRVLGTPRGRTQIILVLQQAATCFAGLVPGVVGMLVYMNQVRPELLEALGGAAVWRAAAYLAAAVFGAAVSSTAVTNKNPLEMLQVKE